MLADFHFWMVTSCLHSLRSSHLCQVLAELGWLFPERRYLKRITPEIAAG
jgi:hypothetical protein